MYYQDPTVNELSLESNNWFDISKQKLSEDFMTKFKQRVYK